VSSCPNAGTRHGALLSRRRAAASCELWVLVEPKEPGRIGPSSKYLCAKCTEDLREWFLAPTKDRSALGEGP
jgi:hypothetical protein